ncbi:Crp/Fnr family transcriptional regulator [Novosphingobium sp.]|uniref:Crp/Fnr family transcriptional regulator n=1 Tax=Novosphingobium sp. TaxID=1874826 RepID=UPI0038B7FE4A|nr:Crp/Fnr family transcriptional regulator [Pseudomonadota bacterium]
MPELETHPYLGGLPDQEQRWLKARLCESAPTSAAGTVHFLVDAVVTVMLATPDAREGTSPRGAIEIGFAGPGQVTGALAMITECPPPDIRIWRPGHALSLHVDNVQSLRQCAPVLERRLRRAAGNEVMMLARALTRHMHGSARERVASHLLDLHLASQDTVLPGSHGEIAEALALRRATVTVALQDLESARTIRGRRGEIEIVDAAGLERAAGE